MIQEEGERKEEWTKEKGKPVEIKGRDGGGKDEAAKQG